MRLQKVHGSQNSFFILDQTLLKRPLTDSELVNLTKNMTSTTTGILNGADGILSIEAPTSKEALAKMRVINADGSEASMCGNGLRTVGRYLADKYHQESFLVETLQAKLAVTRQTPLAPNVPAFGVEIAPIYFEKEHLPFANLGADKIIDQPLVEFDPSKKTRFSILAVPNPHLVGFVTDIKSAAPLLKDLGQRLNQANPYFSDGVNVNFAEILGPKKLFVRTYERGVGFTNACGTGMSATSLAFHLSFPKLCPLNEEITVFNPGGMVKTKVTQTDQTFELQLIGNATVTHLIEVSEQALHQNNVTQTNCTITATNEQAAYLDFIQKL